MSNAFRPEPVGRPDQYKTYAIRPLKRKGSCASVDCEAMQHGWQIRIEDLSPEMLYTAKNSGRKFKELEVDASNHYLIFEAGQPCFRDGMHEINLVGEERYFVGRGDHRLFTTRRAESRTAETFVDDMATHLDKIREEIQKG